MLNDITIGRYIANDTPVHRMNAAVKILMTVLYIIALFMVDTPFGYLILIATTVCIICVSRIGIGYILRGIKAILFILIFTAVINLFFTGGTRIFELRWSFINIGITYEGVILALKMFLRLTLLVVTTSLLTLTTPPLMLTDGIESLLKPLNIVKVPVREISMMMSIAIRFIPTLSDEAQKIKKAQSARGADFDSGGLSQRAKALVPILIPLFVSAFRRADELATAMDARCYGGGKKRTRLRESAIKRSDILYFTVFTLILIMAVICGGIL